MTDATLPDLATKGGLAALALALVLRAGWYAVTRLIEAMDRLSAASTASASKVADNLDQVITAMGGLSVQSVGMVLDDGNHPVQASDIVGNSYGTGVATGRL